MRGRGRFLSLSGFPFLSWPHLFAYLCIVSPTWIVRFYLGCFCDFVKLNCIVKRWCLLFLFGFYTAVTQYSFHNKKTIIKHTIFTTHRLLNFQNGKKLLQLQLKKNTGGSLLSLKEKMLFCHKFCTTMQSTL